MLKSKNASLERKINVLSKQLCMFTKTCNNISIYKNSIMESVSERSCVVNILSVNQSQMFADWSTRHGRLQTHQQKVMSSNINHLLLRNISTHFRSGVHWLVCGKGKPKRMLMIIQNIKEMLPKSKQYMK